MNNAALRYQPPLPADQVKASTEFDYERGKITCHDGAYLCVSVFFHLFLLFNF